MPSRTLACIECKCSGYGHLLFWGLARCVFVLQKPFCATKRLAPGVASAAVRLQSRHLILYEKPSQRIDPKPPKWDARIGAAPKLRGGGDEREVKGAIPFVHTKIRQAKGLSFLRSAR